MRYVNSIALRTSVWQTQNQNGGFVMEELYQRLRVLEKVTYELDSICSLIYILKDALGKMKRV